ncbi:hypothetical protein [Microbacterium sp. CIAB417]|uniref:hypothetical protein n=1 Tax=Microbacterium sp. CIAB417 TaxID=2860287 RepID=UPI001FAB3B47|nr:hypothetical protein [Microbacterium sp. CIAB417]
MRFRVAAASGILLLSLAGCAAPAAPSTTEPTSEGDGHGHIEGAQELAEPALHLTTVDEKGSVHHLDLLDEEDSVLADIDPVEEVVSDGRYLFGIRDGSVTVIDSGVWTWSHIDHFHYYEAPARVIGDVSGNGTPAVVTGEVGVGVRFDDEAVLLDTAALADGRIEETFRIAAEGDGVVVPLTSGAVLTDAGAGAEQPGTVRVVGNDGTASEELPCASASGTITTVVGVVIGCADGALLFAGGAPEAHERIPYPQATAPAATSFAAREGRPSVAALAGETGVWILDTRERAWTLVDVGEPLVHVAAVDDAEGRVLALTADGAVIVLAGGAVVSRTEPLVSASLADDEVAPHVRFVVDQNRAYLNGPLEQTMWEIDPADGARLSRVFETASTPLHLAGTGR